MLLEFHFDRLYVDKRIFISMGSIGTQYQPMLHGRENIGCGTF